MKKFLIFNFSFLIMLLMLVSCHKKPADQQTGGQEDQQQEQTADSQELTADTFTFPDITGVTLEGTELSLSDLVGQSDYVLLDFWASWCGPCRRYIPVLRDYYYRFGGDRLEILSCSVDQDEAAWREAMFEERFPWQSMREDADHPCSEKYGVQYIPFTVLIDREGVIVAINPEEPELEAILLGE